MGWGEDEVEVGVGLRVVVGVGVRVWWMGVCEWGVSEGENKGED